MRITPKKKVCIIGAGASGLAAIRHVSESVDLEGIVFESTENIGGLWVYSEEVRDKQGNPVHSSMYDSIRTHLPKQLMAYPDFPFDDTPNCFLSHKEMLKYMKDFAQNFNLLQFIKFNHKVINVKPIPIESIDDRDRKWMVTVEVDRLGEKTWQNYQFDAVMVCNGHCFKPFIPQIDNQEVFKGQIIHSRDYRRPDPFKGRNVIIIGGGLTALDLATEIASQANNVLFSHKGKRLKDSWLEKNVTQVGKIESLTANGVIHDGNCVPIDDIVFCTGYEYSYPFLSLPECSLQIIDGKYVTPLYRHFIHSKYPTMSFLGLPFLNAAFSLFDCQARFFVKFLEGHVILPSEAEMNLEIEYEFTYKRNNGLPLSKSHSMENNPWDQYEILGKEAGFNTSWIPLLRSIYNNVNQRRMKYPNSYKNDKITVINQSSYQYECVEEEIQTFVS